MLNFVIMNNQETTSRYSGDTSLRVLSPEYIVRIQCKLKVKAGGKLIFRNDVETDREGQEQGDKA